MIQDKIVTITKENCFDKGWTLFRPFEMRLTKNRSFSPLLAYDLISAITRCDSVFMILSEPCLPSSVLEELKWANPYIDITLIAKDQGIADRYSNLKFAKVEIDNTVGINYVGVHGKNTLCVMIADAFIVTDDTPEQAYLGKNRSADTFAYLAGAQEVLIVDPNATGDFSSLVAACKAKGVAVHYVIAPKNFNKSILERVKSSSANMLVGTRLHDGIYVTYDTGKICRVQNLASGVALPCEIGDLSLFASDLYQNLFYEDKVSMSRVDKNAYVCFNGKIKRLDIQAEKAISIPVAIATMEDFLAEHFDSSVTEKHNDYCTEAKKVMYRFTLQPPVFDDSYRVSAIYNDVVELNKKLQSVQIDWKRIIQDYQAITETKGLDALCDEIETLVAWLKNAASKCEYKEYKRFMAYLLEIHTDTEQRLFSLLGDVFSEVNAESSGTKFDRFDAEIAGYQQTIKEKEELITRGVEVLANKHRVERLQKKIGDLQRMKAQFEARSGGVNDKSKGAFLAKCRAWAAGNDVKHDAVDDSIGNVLRVKEVTKAMLLETFAQKHLHALCQYFEKSIPILQKLCEIDIPEDYRVYDKNGERYIVLDDVKEYDKTKAIREKYNLKALARR